MRAEMAADAAEAPVAKQSPLGEGQAGVAVAGTMLAYTYQAQLTLPVQHVRPMLAAHEKVCVDAGPAVCQVIGSSANQVRDDFVTGALELRAAPKFVEALAATLEGDARKMEGRIEQSRSSEDLTRQIVDTEAALRAKTTLRDRLQALLRDRPGKLSDLLETEQALANVQQEIDSAQSYLKEMRQRVDTSRLTIAYMTLEGPTPSNAFEPLADAFNSFLRNVSASLAAMVTALAVFGPWLLIFAPLAWFGWRALRGVLPWRQKAATPSGENQS